MRALGSLRVARASPSDDARVVGRVQRDPRLRAQGRALDAARRRASLRRRRAASPTTARSRCCARSTPSAGARDGARDRPDDAREARDPGHHSNKHLFHQLITDGELARVRGRAVGARGLAVECAASGRTLATCADAAIESERAKIEAFFGTLLKGARGAPTLTRADGCSFANVGGRPGEHTLHVNTTASVREAYERTSSWERTGETMEDFARRFRPNLVVEDAGDGALKPFDEFAWCGRDVRFGEVVVRVDEPTIRCPSTRVRYDESGDAGANVDAGARPDVDIRAAFPALEASIFGRDPVALADRGSYFGVYARVVVGGVIRVGDDVALLP